MRFEKYSIEDPWICLWASGQFSRGVVSGLRSMGPDWESAVSALDGSSRAWDVDASKLAAARDEGFEILRRCQSRFGGAFQVGVDGARAGTFHPLSIVGPLPALPVLAVVGTRALSATVAERLRAWMGRHLGGTNGVISGGASGVDTIAHEVSLDLGLPTWVVFGGGLLKPTPKSGVGVFERVLQRGGGWISEKAPNASPRDYDFIERNKVIAALAEAVLVARAPARSGALSTARSALRMGKPVVYLGWDFDDEGADGAAFLAAKGCRAVYRASCLSEVVPAIFQGGTLELPCSGASGSEGTSRAIFAKEMDASIRASWGMFLQWSSGTRPWMGSSPSEHAEILLDLELEGLIRVLAGGDCALTELGDRMRNITQIDHG